MSYGEEPRRSEKLLPASVEPFNAETSLRKLVQSYITPAETFFVRNHAPVPVLDAATYRLEINGLVDRVLTLSVAELQAHFEANEVSAALQCAGNRRNEMNRIRKVKGLGWNSGAVGNATWRGVMLRDVLLAAGLDSSIAAAGAGSGRELHVEFEGLDGVKEHDFKTGYGSSIPLATVMRSDSGVLLAWAMNGETLTPDHGFPLRVVVPGHIGARSVKWLKRVTVADTESRNFFQQRDYKLFHAGIDWDVVDQWWDRASPIQEMNVQCVICESAPLPPSAGTGLHRLRGYALSGGGRAIERVDVSVNGGETWDCALLQQPGGGFAWCLWSIDVPINPPCELVARAWDASSNTQPETMAAIWNLRGVLGNAWYRVPIEAPAQLTQDLVPTAMTSAKI